MAPQTKQSPTKLVTSKSTQTSSDSKGNLGVSNGSVKNKDRYVMPIIGISVPAKIVEKGFFAALIASVALGTVDPPLGLLIGTSVLIARHRKNSK
jgi:hypothetical protein